MKTNLINQFHSQMTRFQTVAFLMAMVIFSACEKDTFGPTASNGEAEEASILNSDLQNADPNQIDSSLVDLLPTEAPENAIQIELPELNDKPGAIQLRSNSAFKCEYDVYVDYHKWVYYYFDRHQLPDPMRWKVKVVLTPEWQDADLYCHGYDTHNGNWRTIRHGARRGHGAQESLTYRLTDLHSYEDRLYINVYGYKAARFKICFYYYPVDCQEYPAADQIVPHIYQPVCGCDGQTYGNSHAAKAAGITYWTPGECHGGGHHCDYYFEDHFNNYHYGYIGPQSHKWTTWNHRDGTHEDCEIVSSSDPHRGKILKIYDDNPHKDAHGHQNIIRKLGNLRHGKYELKWDMYVKDGHRAFYTIQHKEHPGEYACSVVFWYNGKAKLILGKYDYHRPIQHQNYVREIGYHHGRWFKVKHIIDLDHGRIDLYIDGHHFYSWDFPIGYPDHHLNQLGAVNFKGFDQSKFFIDNLKLNCL